MGRSRPLLNLALLTCMLALVTATAAPSPVRARLVTLEPGPSPTATPEPIPSPGPSPGPTATLEPAKGPSPTASPRPEPDPTATPSPAPTPTPEPNPDASGIVPISYPQPDPALSVYDPDGHMAATVLGRASALLADVERRTGARLVVYVHDRPSAKGMDQPQADALALLDQWEVKEGLVFVVDVVPTGAGACDWWAWWEVAGTFGASYLPGLTLNDAFDRDVSPDLEACRFGPAVLRWAGVMDRLTRSASIADHCPLLAASKTIPSLPVPSLEPARRAKPAARVAVIRRYVRLANAAPSAHVVGLLDIGVTAADSSYSLTVALEGDGHGPDAATCTRTAMPGGMAGPVDIDAVLLRSVAYLRVTSEQASEAWRVSGYDALGSQAGVNASGLIDLSATGLRARDLRYFRTARSEGRRVHVLRARQDALDEYLGPIIDASADLGMSGTPGARVSLEIVVDDEGVPRELMMTVETGASEREADAVDLPGATLSMRLLFSRVGEAVSIEPPIAGVQPPGSMTAARTSASSVMLPDGRVLLVGSELLQGCLSTVETFDPAAGSFRLAGLLSGDRCRPTATRLADGRILVIEGPGAADVYDPVTGRLAPADRPLHDRYMHTATLLASGDVLVTGGLWGGASMASAEVFRASSGRFLPTGSLRQARAGHTATLLPGGGVLIAGGWLDERPLSSAELFDPVAGRFRPAPVMPSARGGHAATLLADGRVLIAGGWDGRSTLGTALLYDPMAQEWEQVVPMGQRRESPSVTLLADGRMLLAGGWDENGQESDLVLLFDPQIGSFRVGGTLMVPRAAHSAVLLADGRVLIAGGYSLGEPQASAEIFDPVTGRSSMVADAGD